MSNSSSSESSTSSTSSTVILAVRPEATGSYSPADIEEIGSEVYSDIHNAGIEINPSNTGRKGGFPTFNVIIQIYQYAADHQDMLLTVANSILLVINHLLAYRNIRAR